MEPEEKKTIEDINSVNVEESETLVEVDNAMIPVVDEGISLTYITQEVDSLILERLLTELFTSYIILRVQFISS